MFQDNSGQYNGASANVKICVVQVSKFYFMMHCIRTLFRYLCASLFIKKMVPIYV